MSMPYSPQRGVHIHHTRNQNKNAIFTETTRTPDTNFLTLYMAKFERMASAGAKTYEVEVVGVTRRSVNLVAKHFQRLGLRPKVDHFRMGNRVVFKLGCNPADILSLKMTIPTDEGSGDNLFRSSMVVFCLDTSGAFGPATDDDLKEFKVFNTRKTWLEFGSESNGPFERRSFWQKFCEFIVGTDEIDYSLEINALSWLNPFRFLKMCFGRRMVGTVLDHTSNPDGLCEYGLYLRDGVDGPVDLVAAVQFFRASAERGYVNAQLYYGYALLEGIGSDRDEEKGARYLRMAAEAGNREAQSMFASCLFEGRGVNKDELEAGKYLKLAADAGNTEAQCMLAACLVGGRGVDKDESTAARYFQLAADAGHVEAQCIFGEICSKAHDESKAAKYFELAANAGHSEGQYKYGRCLLYGRGVHEHKDRGFEYMIMAADQGHERAKNYIRCK